MYEPSRHISTFYIAGFQYYDGALVLGKLKPGKRLKMVSEPENPYDPKAIMIQTETGTKIGYVPERDNLVFARLMDAGKQLFARIKEKETRGKWLRIQIGIYLQD